MGLNGCETGSVSHGMTMKSTDMRELGLSTSWSTITLIVGLNYSATGTHQLGCSARYHADQTTALGWALGMQIKHSPQVQVASIRDNQAETVRRSVTCM